MARILAVDDDPAARFLLCDTLSRAGHFIDQAPTGEIAWTLLGQNDFDLVLLDRKMPELDGLGLLKRMKAEARFRGLPVIMQTAADTQQEIREGLEAGAYYYLAKPFSPEVLEVLVASVIDDFAERKRLRDVGANFSGALKLLQTGLFSFRTPTEVRSLAACLSEICAAPEDAAIGLLELMVNAVEHGNLGITYAEKTILRRSFHWDQEMEHRLATPPWSERTAIISVRHDGPEVEFTITDEGAGFDWKQYLQFDPVRAFDNHGRGIAIAKSLSFSSVEFRGSGNIVVARTEIDHRSADAKRN